MITLPTIKSVPKVLNPRFLVLFGKPKTGKTTLLSTLESCLIVDLEGGSEFLEAMAVQARSVADLGEVITAIKAKTAETGEKPYKYIAIDNATRLEDMCLPYAATLYRQNPIAKNWAGTDVRTLDKGAGYLYLREAVKTVIDQFRALTDTFILIGHTKDSLITKDGQELSEMQIDLVGKLGDIVCGEADAVGYVYRKTNETILSFEGGTNSVREARAPHLRGQKIVIAESDKENKITTHWDRVFLDDNK